MAEKTNDGHSTLLHGKYELGRLLGHGTFAKVYHARNLQSGKSVAMKVVGKEKVIKVGMMEQIKREISVMKMVKHPNIVELHEVMASKSKIYFAMDLVRGGELFSKIAKGRLPEDGARVYFQQLISAIDFCHSRGVYHRDLKPENLLLDEDGNLKVTDFGLSAFSEHLKQDGLLHTTCGTPAYVAPEVIGKKGYDGAQADLWSCGVILYVLLAGFLPFQDDNIVAMYRKIYRGDFKCPPWFSSEARRLITKMGFHPVTLVLLFALALSGIQLSTCQVLKGKLSCLDCSGHYDFSEIKVGVKCDKVRRLATTTTQSDGSFEVKLPSDTSATATPLNCVAKLLGAPSQLYVSRQNMVSKIVQTRDSNSYTISTPLSFSTTCSGEGGKCGVSNEFGSSKTIDLPLPREWGLAPSSYYVPFVPIIGIP